MSNAKQPKMRKVYVKVQTPHGETCESFWANEIEGDIAKIANIPFLTDAVGFDDLVRVSPTGEVVEVLERFTRTQCATYKADCNKKKAQQQWQTICGYLEPHVVVCESACPGLFAMAVPIDLTDNGLREICGRCPVPLKLVSLDVK